MIASWTETTFLAGRHSIKEYYSHYGLRKAGSVVEPAISHHSLNTEASLDEPGEESEIFLSKPFRQKLDEVASQWIAKDQVTNS